jgi:hypothetical protein
MNEVELEHIRQSGFETATLSTLYSITAGPEGWSRRSRRCANGRCSR